MTTIIQTHTVPTLQGTLAKHTKPTLKPNFAKEPSTIHRVDVLASWNFRHIVNLDRIKGYNSVNYRLGYPMIEIRSPKDLLHYED
jgi:hypothetical protein